MTIAELFQQTEPLWAENPQTLREQAVQPSEVARSLDQRPDFSTSAGAGDPWTCRRDAQWRDEPGDDFQCEA